MVLYIPTTYGEIHELVSWIEVGISDFLFFASDCFFHV